MKSQINLYRKELQPVFELYSAQNLVIVSVFCALLIGIATGSAYYLKTGVEANLANAQSSLNRTEKEVSELQRELEARAKDPLLKAKLQAVTQNVETQQKLVMQIQSLSGMKNKSLSGLFDAFSDNHQANLWLTSFTVNENDLTIKGELSQPSALPNWINGLTNATYFNGQEFNDAIVERKEKFLAFELTHEADRPLTDEQASSQVSNSRGGSNGGN